MATFLRRKSVLCLLLASVFLICLTLSVLTSASCAASYTIELHDFSWSKFPLNVLVDMNEWSLPDYAIAVHEALDDWVNSLWNYTHSFANTTFMINYIFYVSNINLTNNYDVLITFTQNEIPPSSNTVGLTTFEWYPTTHEPIPPITINITTYSKTADLLFVKNVVMHEFGHALGLGHASSPRTSNGPELMYYTSSNNQILYPSTLDVYGLLQLYQGNFGQIVQLPFTIPYKMLAERSTPSYPIQPSPLDILYPSTSEIQYVLAKPYEIIYKPMILLIPSALWMAIALVFGFISRSGKTGVIITITISVFIALYIASWTMNPVSLSLKIILLLPAMGIGAFVGGFIGNRFSSELAS